MTEYPSQTTDHRIPSASEAALCAWVGLICRLPLPYRDHAIQEAREELTKIIGFYGTQAKRAGWEGGQV